MRVIAGSARGRRLKAVPGWNTRPTSDRVREALFSILLSRFDLHGATLLDLYAGTGAVGIEALSRGADRVVFVESDRRARGVLATNLSACGFAARGDLLPLPVGRALAELARRGEGFDGIFVDPPYGRGLAQEVLEQVGRLALLVPGGWLMAESHADEPLAERFGALRLTLTRRYGKTRLTLFVADATLGEAAKA